MNTDRKTLLFVDGALFSAEGKLLLLHRRQNDAWQMPGGELEFGEGPELGLIRCFAETTGVDVSADRPLGAWSELERVGNCETFSIHIDYVVRSTGALTSVDVDRDVHAGFAWLTQTEALARIDTPALRDCVARAFTLLARARKGP